MEETKRRFSPFLRQCFVTTAVAGNQIAQGSLTGFPAILLPQLHQADSAIVTSKAIDSWIASVSAITLIVGSFMTPPVMDHCGRKMVHYIVSATLAASWAMMSLATSVEVILVARIIGGLSFGMMMPLRSVLVSEYTSPHRRGSFLTTISFTTGLGIFVVHGLGTLLTWNKTALVLLFLPMISFIMTMFIPESPSYLLSKRKYDECKKAFRWVRGDDEEEELDAMIRANMELHSNKKVQKKIRLIDQIRQPEFYKPIILMWHIYAIPHMCGVSLTANFATTLIKAITNADVNADVWMIVFDGERIIVNAFAIYVMHKVKRRTMLFANGGACITSFLGTAAYVYAKKLGFIEHDILWIPGALLLTQYFTVALALVPLPSIIAGEVFPLQYRSIAGTLSLISTSGNMFLLLKTFPALLENIGISATYVLYAIVATYCLIVAWFLLPETKDRTLQDIEDEYRGKVTSRDVDEVQKLQTAQECHLTK